MSTTPEPPSWSPEPGEPGAQPDWSVYQPPTSPDVPYLPQVHSGANLAMWLGIGSLACSFGGFACFLTIPGVVIGPIAVVQAVRANREIEASPGRYSNSSAATTGLITGIIGTAVGLLMLVLLVISLAGSLG